MRAEAIELESGTMTCAYHTAFPRLPFFVTQGTLLVLDHDKGLVQFPPAFASKLEARTLPSSCLRVMCALDDVDVAREGYMVHQRTIKALHV